VNAVLKIEKDEAPTLSSLAREYLAETAGDVQEAAGKLSNRILDDRQLRAALVEEAIESASREMVEHQMRTRRQSIWANAGTPAAKTGIVALAQGIANSLFDFPLAGGKRLRDATPEEALAQAQLYRAAAKDMSAKDRFLVAVAKRGKPGVRLGDTLTEDDVLAIHQKVMK